MIPESPYNKCPICSSDLVFLPISQLFDKDGAKYGFRLHCKTCSWYDCDRFYSKEDVKNAKRTTEIKKTASIETQKKRNKNTAGKSDIDKYYNYFLKHYENEPISMMEFHSILRDTFSIKTSKTRGEILKRLSRREDVKHSGNTFTFTSRLEIA